jgi:hypothetical protein
MNSKAKLGIGLMVGGVLISLLAPVLFRSLITDISMVISVSLISLAILLPLSLAGVVMFLKTISNKKTQAYKDGKLLLVFGVCLPFIPILFSLFYMLTEFTFFSIVTSVLSSFYINYILGFVLLYLGVRKLQGLKNTESEELLSGANPDDTLEGSGEKVPLKKSIFTYISIGIVSLLFTASAAIMFMDIYYMKSTETVLPVNCMQSNFFWFLLIAGTIIAIFSVGFQEHRPLYKGSDGKIYESMDITDQMGSGLLTFLSPVLVGAIIALVPYYLLYWLFNLAASNVFILVAIMAVSLALVVLVFLYTKPKFSRTREVVWAILWTIISGGVLYMVFFI